MVSGAAIASMWFTLLVSTVLPIVLLFIVCRHQRGFFGCACAGILGFWVPQVVIRMPLLQLPAVNAMLISLGSAGSSFVLALTAGLFETTGRLLVFLLILKKARTWQSGVAAGIGHGWCEAVFLIGSSYISNLYTAYLINSQGMKGLLAAGLNETTAQQVLATFTATSPLAFLAAGTERIMTIAFHILASVLLLALIARGKTAAGFCIVWALHTLFDCLVPLLNVLFQFPLAAIALELVLAAVFVFGIAYVRRLFPRPDTGPVSAPEFF